MKKSLKSTGAGEQIFRILNYSILTILGALCLFPMINVLALSFSSSGAATAGYVKLWPVEFTLSSYKYVLSKQEFITALFVSFERLLLGVSVNMLLTILIAYPLSKSNREFKSRSFYTWYFMVTILFTGGLVPGYMAMSAYGLLDSIWVLVLPGAVQVFSVIILMNFFRQLPKEIEEAAFNRWCRTMVHTRQDLPAAVGSGSGHPDPL